MAALVVLLAALHATPAAATVCYVSRSTGSDGDHGLTPGNPFATLAKVNGLALHPGDQVRLLCGDTWRGERLVIDDSGTAAMPTTYTSEPPGCANQPVVSGAQPIVGWVLDAGNVYRADLAAGGNAGRFPGGVNQLPRWRAPALRALAQPRHSQRRLIHHRRAEWQHRHRQPAPGGKLDGRLHPASLPVLVPAAEEVTGHSGNTLTLNEAALCRLPLTQCDGWGFFLNHRRNLLDAEGEWFIDAATNRVYVVSGSGPPANNTIEGSVVGTASDPDEQSGVTIGTAAEVHYVTVDNLDVRRWAGNGIQMALIVFRGKNSHVSILDNTVVDVALAGIRLSSFVFFGMNDPRNACAAAPRGWSRAMSSTAPCSTASRPSPTPPSSCATRSATSDCCSSSTPAAWAARSPAAAAASTATASGSW